MKKALLFIPFVLVLASCNNSASSISNQKEVDELKELLNKQDLSDFTSKGFGTMFTQEYNVLDVVNDLEDEEEKSASYFNYVGLGFLDLYYSLNDEQYNEVVDENGDVNVFDAIAVGEGGYRVTQLVKSAAFYRQGGLNSTFENLDVEQKMTLKATDDDVIVYNVLYASDTQVFHYDLRQEFNGCINKELLFSSISTRSFREIFSQVNLFDSPSNVEYLDKLYFSLCKKLKASNDKEISQFIIDNQISITESKESLESSSEDESDKRLELSFVYQGDDIDEEYVDYIFPGKITGTLFYDKETGSFDEFKYEIKYINESYDEESGSVRTANMIFTCAGMSTRGAMGDMRTPDDPIVYDDVVEFLEKVSEEVVPPSL